MIVCGLDFETTGLDAKRDRVIEIGAALWDTSTAVPLKLLSCLCADQHTPNPFPPEIVEITGLTYEMVMNYGVLSQVAFAELTSLAGRAEAVIAHFGASFDKDFYLSECARTGVTPIDLTWIDTAIDLKFPQRMFTRNLTHLAAEHGFLNPFTHRAVFDVLTMLRIFQNYDPVAALEYARQPIQTLEALVSYDDRQLAKDRNYRWLPRPGAPPEAKKAWLKDMRQSDADKEIAEAGFPVKIINTKG